MIPNDAITALRMRRQYLLSPAGEAEYNQLYRDLSPGQNVYWCGFGDPPTLSFRADFNDMEYNRGRMLERKLVKGRFQGGNLGWIEPEELELYAGLFCKPLAQPTSAQTQLLDLITHIGPLNIQAMKEATGLLVKEITPVLHRLQEAFLIFEDQYNGEWDRGWDLFSRMYPDLNIAKYTRLEALRIVLRRFAYRHVWFDLEMAKSYFKLPVKELKAAIASLAGDGELVENSQGYILKADNDEIERSPVSEQPRSVLVLHRNDFLVKSNEHWLKPLYKHAGYDTLQYILVDGEFRGAVLGHFKNGPYILEDVVVQLPAGDAEARREEIIEAIYLVNSREASPLARYAGESN